MNDHQDTHLDPAGVALSALAACIVQTLSELDPSFRPTFDKNLEDIYYRIRDSENPSIASLEMLTFVRDLLKK